MTTSSALSPRAAHRTAQGSATRDRIVDGAAELMFVRGVRATSLDDVRAATSTSKGQLYHYFVDKDDLVLAVVERQSSRVLGYHEHLLADVDSPEGLRRWADALIAHQRAQLGVGGCPVGSLASELADSREPARLAVAATFARWESLLTSALLAMRARTPSAAAGHETPPADLAAAIMAGLQGGLLLTQATRSTRHLELALDTALRRVEQEMAPPL